MSEANQHTGEVQVFIDNTEYALRPSYEAIRRIEAETGKTIYNLARCLNGEFWTLSEMAIIVTEGIKAWGRAQSRNDTEAFTYNRIAECLFEGGLVNFNEPIVSFLMNCLTGGAAPKNQPAAAKKVQN